MGLDMYLEGERFNPQVCWKTGEEIEDRPTRDGFYISSEILEMGYWRKHPNLHGYIVHTFAKGLVVTSSKPIYLDAKDCRKIAAAILAADLPHTTGFFFGDSDWHKADREDNAKIFSNAAQWLDDADWTRRVYYKASW